MTEIVAQVPLVAALLLPGFLVVQLSESRRVAVPPGGDFELVLRALAYAPAIHAVGALTGWLPALADRLDRGRWVDHLDSLAAYGLLMCVLAPTAIGLALGAVLRRAELGEGLTLRHYALGGRDSRHAWDYVFSRLDGAWLLIFLREPPPVGSPVLVGRFGRRSYATRTSSGADLYVEAVWPADSDGRIVESVLEAGDRIPRGAWLERASIARIEVIAEGPLYRGSSD